MTGSTPRQVGIGSIGSGSIAEHDAIGLGVVPEARIVADTSTGGERGDAFGRRFGVVRTHGSIEASCADATGDRVVVRVTGES